MAARTCPIQTGRTAEPDPIDPRAPAHAVRQLVQQEGREAPRALYEAFDAYNAEHFGGLLKQSLILLTTPASPRAEGDYVAQDVHGIPSRIRIAPRCEQSGLLYLQDVLLHDLASRGPRRPRERLPGARAQVLPKGERDRRDARTRARRTEGARRPSTAR